MERQEPRQKNGETRHNKKNREMRRKAKKKWGDETGDGKKWGDQTRDGKKGGEKTDGKK